VDIQPVTSGRRWEHRTAVVVAWLGCSALFLLRLLELVGDWALLVAVAISLVLFWWQFTRQSPEAPE